MRGFTLVELIVSVSLLALIAGMAVVGFKNYADYQNFVQTVSEVTLLVEQARVEGRSAFEEEPHGIYVQTNSITVFPGQSYDSMEPRNETTNFPKIRLVHNFSDAGDEIIFSQLNGVPSATGTIMVISDLIPATSTLYVLGVGVVQ